MKTVIISPQYFAKQGGVVRFTPPKRKKMAVETVVIEHYAPYMTSELAKLVQKLNYFAFVIKERFYDNSSSYTVVICKNRSIALSIDTDHDYEPLLQKYDAHNRYASYTCWPENAFYIASDIYDAEISIGSKNEFKCMFSKDNGHIIFNRSDTSGIDFVGLSIRVLERVID
ncbi:hypothetical protein IK110_04595 [Candidatus Saccharibacteria bacterium]|nr:hypothetical protein [Candidatus Saccharibacteria bacterium]